MTGGGGGKGVSEKASSGVGACEKAMGVRLGGGDTGGLGVGVAGCRDTASRRAALEGGKAACGWRGVGGGGDETDG